MARPLKIKKISRTDRIDKAAMRILRTRLKEYYSHWPDPEREVTPEQLHDMRISGKRLRYSAETWREFYPDRLTLLIDLLKRGQDLLGEIQDCVTQREMIEEDLARLKQRDAGSADIVTFEKMLAEYDQRREQRFIQFRELWRGMALKEFRNCLKTMVTDRPSPKVQTKSDQASADPPVTSYFY